MSEFYTENIKNERSKRKVYNRRRKLLAFVCFAGLLLGVIIGFISNISRIGMTLSIVVPVVLIEENEKGGKNEIYRGL